MKNLGRLISVGARSTSSLTRVGNASFSSVSAKTEEKKQYAPPKQKLYTRLSYLGHKKGMVSTIIDNYISEGTTPTKPVLDKCVKELHIHGKPHLALEIMDWMETKGMNKSDRDYPVYLTLVAKVKGIEEAELFFKEVSDKGTYSWTYGALLNCYCKELMEDKALALFKEMGDRNLAFTPVTFGNVMSLYMKLGKPEKVAPLVEDMKKRNMELTSFTYCLWMTSCSQLGDIEGAERVFEEIKQDSPAKCNWDVYSNLGAIYVKAGHNEKAKLTLKRAEQEMRPQDVKAYYLLLSLYAGLSNSSEVHRVWNTLKQNFKVVTNISYLVMLNSLSKLDDLVGLKDCYDEWESKCHNYDSKLAHKVIKVYLKHHMVEEAQAIFQSAKKRSSGHPCWISETFMTYYLENNQGQQALDCMKAAVSQVTDNEWHLKDDILKEFLQYFEEIGDVDFGEEFCQLLKKVNSLKYAAYKSLLRAYIVAGKKAPNMAERIKGDGIVVDMNLKDLLQKVCPE